VPSSDPAEAERVDCPLGVVAGLGLGAGGLGVADGFGVADDFVAVVALRVVLVVFGFGGAVAALRERLVAAFGAADVASFADEPGREVGALVVDPRAVAPVVDRVVVDFGAAPRAEVFAGVVAVAAAVLGRLREPGGRPRRRGVVAGFAAELTAEPPGGLEGRIGVRTWLAWTAADPTVRAAPPIAPPTAPAAEDPAETAVDAALDAADAADAARPATFVASAATSDSDSATCLRRFATSFLPLPATAVASCLTRFASVFRAAASCFSSLRSSLPALLDSGVTTPLASTMTSATVSTTTSRRPLLPPSSRLAIDRPPACRAQRATAASLPPRHCPRKTDDVPRGRLQPRLYEPLTKDPTGGYPARTIIGAMTAPTAGEPDGPPDPASDRPARTARARRRTPLCGPGSIAIDVEDRAARRADGARGVDEGDATVALLSIDEGLPEDLVLAGLEARLPVAESTVLDLRAHELRRDGRTVPLRPKEYQLLVTLAANPGRAFSRRQLLDLAWDRERDIDTRTVDVHVHWLRAKIETTPRHPSHLITIRGFGYRLDPWPNGSR
jgi:transcriptional regulator